MAFKYLTGITDAGAVDHVLDWFTTFEAWISGQVGWTIQAGAGTKSLVIRSLGENRRYTMLYARVWESVMGTVRAEVRNDLAGTQQTNEGGLLLSNNAQFTYHMAADQEAILIVFINGLAQTTWIYFGCVWPFALAPPDETYTMISTSGLAAASVLRDFDDTWDVDITMRSNPHSVRMYRSPFGANAYQLFGLVAGVNRGIVGQLKHMSGNTHLTQLAAADTLGSYADGRGNKVTEWLVVRDTVAQQFAIRTGGDLPVGVKLPDSYRYQAGITDGWPGYDTFIADVLATFLTGIGWQDLGAAGVHTFSRLFYSQGELGTDDIYVIFAFQVGVGWYLYVQDDLAGTNRTVNVWFTFDSGSFPARYYMAGDLDCFVVTMEGTNHNEIMWAGKLLPGDRAIPSTPYALAVWCAGTGRLLRSYAGVWNPGTVDIIDEFLAAGVGIDSSPSAFDDQTHLMFPFGMTSRNGLVDWWYQGQMKYVWGAEGMGMARGDTILLADETYKVFRRAHYAWMLRTA